MAVVIYNLRAQTTSQAMNNDCSDWCCQSVTMLGSKSCLFPHKFQSGPHDVLCWLAECSLIWSLIQHSNYCNLPHLVAANLSSSVNRRHYSFVRPFFRISQSFASLLSLNLRGTQGGRSMGFSPKISVVIGWRPWVTGSAEPTAGRSCSDDPPVEVGDEYTMLGASGTHPWLHLELLVHQHHVTDHTIFWPNIGQVGVFKHQPPRTDLHLLALTTNSCLF